MKEKKEISKIESEKEVRCNNCNKVLPKILDRGICPYCGRRN